MKALKILKLWESVLPMKKENKSSYNYNLDTGKPDCQS